ncbi:hypothetical protein SUGI_0581180 [Cryptomeria japonica]|nr:hypothetical protein SUGI_0581180 [Cryptomeria japonica]
MWCRIMRYKYLDVDDPSEILTMENSHGGSPIWKFLWKCRGIITNHLSWKVGNGRKATFWRDSWNGGVVLEDIMEDKEVISILENIIGKYVADYFQVNSQVGNSVKWSIKDEGSINDADREKIISELRDRKLVMGEKDDEIIWCVAAFGEYSVKLKYELMKRRSVASWPARLCWNNKVAPSVGAFLWVALHSNILTGERLKKIGIKEPNIFPLRVSAKEDTNHLFRCQFASQCWDWFLTSVGWQTVKQQYMFDFLSGWQSMGKYSLWGDIWIVGPSMIVWKIWKDRNFRVFRDKAHVVHCVIEDIKRSICEVVVARVRYKKVRFICKWDE